MALNRN